MSNSPLATYKKISPNCTSPRTHKIDTITIHCTAGGKKTAKEILNLSHFVKISRTNGASCNYAIGYDGSIGLGVSERDRSWCSSDYANDHRAITIEVASDVTAPNAITTKAYNALIELCVDICQRNGIKELKWKGDKSLIGKVDQQNMTVHRWFSNKACPGDYIYSRLGKIADAVNKKLGVTEKEPAKTTTKKPTATKTKKITATGTADKGPDKSLAGTYKTTAANLKCRNDAGTNHKILCSIPLGTEVKCYGYYSMVGSSKWLYIQFTLDGVQYTGFSSARYLKK